MNGFDPEEMARVIATLQEAWYVAVEMPREGLWITHAAVEHGMLALYKRGSVEGDLAYLIPPSTPIVLRVNAKPRG